MIKNWEQFNEKFQNIDDSNISNYDFSEVEDAIENDDYEYGIELLKKMKNKYPDIKKDETYLELAKRLVHHISVQENKQDKVDMLDFIDDDRNDDRNDDVQLTSYDDDYEDVQDVKIDDYDDEDLEDENEEDDDDMIDLDTHNRIEYDKNVSTKELSLDDAEQAINDEDKDKAIKILRKLKSSDPDITKDKTYLNLLKKLYLL